MGYCNWLDYHLSFCSKLEKDFQIFWKYYSQVLSRKDYGLSVKIVLKRYMFSLIKWNCVQCSTYFFWIFLTSKSLKVMFLSQRMEVFRHLKRNQPELLYLIILVKVSNENEIYGSAYTAQKISIFNPNTRKYGPAYELALNYNGNISNFYFKLW